MTSRLPKKYFDTRELRSSARPKRQQYATQDSRGRLAGRARRGRVRGPKFEVFGTSNPELRTSDCAFLARPATLPPPAGNDLSSVLDSLSPMAPSPQHSARKLSHSRLLLLALLCVVGTACGTTAQSNKVLFEDPRGTVSLQTISDQAIQASHPIDLKPALIARVLSGMQVQEYLQFYQQTMTGEAITPVFLPEEVQFLAPRIAKALATAATGEAVAFLITSPRPGTGSLVYMETTAGSLYAYDQSLYVTLSQYRYDPMLTNMH